MVRSHTPVLLTVAIIVASMSVFSAAQGTVSAERIGRAQARSQMTVADR